MTPPNTTILNSLRRAISAYSQNISTGEAKWLGGGVSALGYLCICANMMFLGWLLFAQPWNHFALLQEDSWVENITVALFLLTGVLLFFTAAAERSSWRRGVYILGGIVMVFAAGEEISWGQRIFNFATPDFLIPLNTVNQFNVHNINGFWGPFAVAYLYGGLTLCSITCVAFFCRKYALFAIPLPSILLALGFIVMASYRAGTGLDLPPFIFNAPKYLLLLLGIFALLRGQAALFIATASTAIVVLAVSYMDGHNRFLRVHEIREYLTSIFCLFYALELLLAQEAARRKIAAVSIELKSAGKRLPLPRGIKSRSGSAPASSKPPDPTPVRAFLSSPLLVVCSLVTMGSIGLTLLQFFSARAEAATIETAYRPIATGAYGEPAIRADFDIYLTNDRLIYYKEECTPKDMRGRFFLRITPVSVYALPDDRGQYGLGTQIFHIDWYGWRFDGKCLGSVPLPEYPIAHINTGQYDYSERRWDVSIVVNSGALEALYESIASGEFGAAVGRSNYDVYISEGRLIYFKETCVRTDTKARFFLHIVPDDMNDLPDDRKRYEFDNLDFDFFHDHGVMLNGKCIVTVPLPEYAIANIRTGQYIPHEGQLWKVEFPFISSAKDASIEERYQSIVSGDIGEPAARSTFDIYLAENALTYTKHPCAPTDIEAPFFLHITPADMDDLPDDRKQYEFDNLDFDFGNSGVMFDGKCMATVPLPEYAIANISTGQYIPDEEQLWKVEFPSSSSAKDAAIEERYQSIVSDEPTARSTFDIYLAENALSYAKQPCAAADVEAPFFLHITPADLNDLPDDRKQYEFDNRDFGFEDHGVMFDGKCMATVPLPEYAIANISTGQYIPDEGQLWKVEFPFTE